MKNKNKQTNQKISIDINHEIGKALKHHQSGQLSQAETIYKNILKIIPDHPDSLHLLGVICHQKGENKLAIEYINRAIQNNPVPPSYYLNNLGSSYQAQGNLDEAILCYKKALKIAPEDILSLNNLGNAFKSQNNFYEAINCYQMALKINPNDEEVYVNIGNLYQNIGHLDEAISHFQRAIQLKPRFPEAFYNMANAFKHKGDLDKAINFYEEAIKISPNFIKSYLNLGAAYQDQDNLSDALSIYQKILDINPSHAEAYNNIGNIYQLLGRQDEAILSFEKAVKSNPGITEAYQNLGVIYEDQSKLDIALSYYQKCINIKPNFGIEIRASLLLPVINESRSSIDKWRKKIVKQIEKIYSRGLFIEDPVKQVGKSVFLTSYQGLNDIEFQKMLASFYIKSCKDLTWTSPYIAKNKSLNKEKIKIGFISKYLCNHTIGELNYGIIKNLSREKFHVVTFHIGNKKDELSTRINNASDDTVFLPIDLQITRNKISDHKLDILFYLDIGMEPFTYFLAFSRLATVQCTTWGHPVTTGIPNMDYFISSQNAETSDADEHYSEKLIRLKYLNTYFYRPELSENNPPREKFNLPLDKNLYVCPQSHFKFHPDFDDIIGEILRKDQKGFLVLITGRNKHWTTLLKNRFSRSIPDVSQRICFLPRMPSQDFIQLLRVADVVLDTPIFCGGKTSLEAFACDIPIVTLPGQFLRGRLTYAMYKQMNIMDCVANNPKEYIDIALKLANDKKYKEEISNKIRNNSHVLFENMHVVRELEEFFIKVQPN